jgi:hypothetical protein
MSEALADSAVWSSAEEAMQAFHAAKAALWQHLRGEESRAGTLAALAAYLDVDQHV